MRSETPRRPGASVSCKYLLWQGESQRVSIKFIGWAQQREFLTCHQQSHSGCVLQGRLHAVTKEEAI